MPISSELNNAIEEEMSALGKNDLLRSGRSYNDFIKEYSELLAQVQEDQEPLNAAGFNDSVLPKYSAYMEKLVTEHSERVNAEAQKSEVVQEFKEGMPRAQADKKLLMAIGRYIIKRSNKPEDKRVYKMVAKGNGQVDTLNDNVTMVGFIRRNTDLASQVRPGGKAVDETVLTRIEQEALHLLKMRGEAVALSDDTSEQVERQNRLITLCVLAERDIKLFAEMAFYNDTERYNRFYASQARSTSKGDTTENDTPDVPTQTN